MAPGTPHLRSRIRSGNTLTGPFSQSASPVLVEMIGYAGFDFVIIDCEHGVAGTEGLADLIRAAAAADLPAIVRVSHNDASEICRALDLGAQGVIAPHIRSVEEAAELVRAARYGPSGARSACPSVRAARYGTIEWNDFYRQQLEEPLVIALIEDERGMSNLAEIVKVPGLDGIFFGPFDLAVSRGIPRDAFDPHAHGERKSVYETAIGNGLFMADLAWDHESIELFAGMGARLIATGVDTTLFLRALGDLRRGIVGPGSSPS